MQLSTTASSIPFIGPMYAKRLEKLGIFSIEDFLHHYPARYLDFSLISKIGQVQAGETVTIRGEIISFSNQYTRRRLTIQKAVIADDSGTLEITWFNQPFLSQSLKKGQKISLAGEVDFFRGKPVMTSPEYEVLRNQLTVHTGRLVPVYHETYGVSSKWLRSRLIYILGNVGDIEDFLPQEIIDRYHLVSLSDALSAIHFPTSQEEVEKAKKRLAFDEIFLVQLSSLYRKREWKSEHTTYKLSKAQDLSTEFIASLPFTMTSSQQKALSAIFEDVGLAKPMNRLLLGDVGSGKTVVAAALMYAFYKKGFRSVLMAPTEILAQQHYQTLQTLFKPFGIETTIITGSTPKKLSNKTIKQSIVVGTHALLFQSKLDLLGLVVIDEQHRFGVEQRTKLREMGIHPHLLAMTATPIPRSIALVLYSELDMSYIDEMPLGRIPVKTWYVSREKREKAYEWIKKELRVGSSQAFIVCPLIEESEHETMTSVKAVTREYELLQKIFSGFTVGLLHGKLPSKKKKEILDAFSSGSIDILLSTPVVEVGIDIPNATIMVIEAAERFGLAQLHQLRGRVGRGKKQSYCLLFSESDNDHTIKRLKSLETITKGAELAELDLKLRGPGELFGTKQHGYTPFKLASYSDHALFAATKEAARVALDEYLKTSELLQKKLKSYTIHKISPN